ncbi:Rieske (2Fe-2S) protein [Conexibacter sp. DBS9H8]|uniref:Rieske (2Fe-2S) protein n=1 Tax=Conexibacter sp. DBS9H8 TaxID=2937801 RepID=UPI00200E2343|nr:Rieske (2Fe-2S) protein [Conexibacter sp. DBS9H8]
MIARLLARIVAFAVAARMAMRRRDSDLAGGEAPGAKAEVSGAASEASGAEAGSGPADAEDPRRREVPANPRAETLVAGLLLAAALLAVAFIAVFVVTGLDTQLLGAALGGSLALIAAAAIVAGKSVVVQETAIEERGTLLEPEAPARIVDALSEAGEGVSRRGLITCAACVAGAAVTTAAVAPIASIGPRLTAIHKTPWHRGVRFTDIDGRLYRAEDITVGSLFTALPEGADPELIGSPLIVLRLPEAMLHLPSSRRGWAPHGILAFSKICPHAACAVSLYRYPEFPSGGNDQPALTCPCHYSTFLPAEGGKLLFGPAGRPLPQLPVLIDPNGYLRAAGGFDEDVGPSWLDVRRPSQT